MKSKSTMPTRLVVYRDTDEVDEALDAWIPTLIAESRIECEKEVATESDTQSEKCQISSGACSRVSSCPSSPSKRSRKDIEPPIELQASSQDSKTGTLLETAKNLSPLFRDLLSMETPSTPTKQSESVDYNDPELRHVWDKENWDSRSKCYSNDRKAKKVKGLALKEGKSGRVPLADVGLRTGRQMISSTTTAVSFSFVSFY